MIPLVIITTAGLLLRIGVLITHGSAWFDEAFSLHFAAKPLSELIGFLPYDVHPPLHTLLLHGWIRLFGDSVASGRALSVLFGTLAIPAVYALTRTVFGRRPGLLAAVFSAASPLILFHSAEARMYGLLFFLLAVSSAALVRYLDDPAGERKALIIWSAASLFAMMTHLTAVIPFLAGAGFAWHAVKRRGEKRAMITASLAAFLPFAAWAAVFIFLRTGNLGGEWQIASAPDGVTALARFTDLFLWGAGVWLRALATVLLIGGFAAAALRWRRTGSELCLRLSRDMRVWYLVTAALLPFLLFLPVSIATTKYLFAGLPAVLALVAGGLTRVFGERRLLHLIGGYLLLALLPVALLLTQERIRIEEAAEFIEMRERAGDVIWASWFVNELTLGRYYDGELPMQGAFPYDRSLSFDERLVRHAGQVAVDDTVIRDMETFIGDAGRVFLVTGEVTISSERPIERWFFERGWRIVDSYEANTFSTVVLLLERPE